MSDYCKGVMRLPDGETPRYVAVASEQNGFPLYKFCLFAKPGLDLNAEDGVEHGRYIANSKVSEFGFGNGTLDVVQLFLQAPRFSVSEPIAVNEANKADVMDRLQAHLRDKSSGAGDGRLKRMKYLIHDNDPLSKGRFDQYVEGAGCKIKRLPPHSPELNGFMESFIKTIKTECLNHFILTSVEQLRYVVNEYLEYYNHERPHSGLGGAMIKPWPQDEDGEVVMFTRLGGFLKSYRRVRKKAA